MAEAGPEAAIEHEAEEILAATQGSEEAEDILRDIEEDELLMRPFGSSNSQGALAEEGEATETDSVQTDSAPQFRSERPALPPAAMGTSNRHKLRTPQILSFGTILIT